MLGLVLFDDGVYYICNKTDITVRGKKCSIRYKDRNRYAGEVIAYDDDKDKLVALKKKLEENSSDCENSETERTEVSKEQEVKKRQTKQKKATLRSNVEKNVKKELTEKSSSKTQKKKSRAEKIVDEECLSVDITSTADCRSASSPEETVPNKLCVEVKKRDREEESNRLTAGIQKEIVSGSKIDYIAPSDDSKQDSSSFGLQSEVEKIVKEFASDSKEKKSDTINGAKQKWPGDNKDVDIALTANSHRSASSPEETDKEEKPNELAAAIQKDNVSESKINRDAPIDDSKRGSSSIGVQSEIHSEKIAQECSSDSKEKKSDTINVTKQECPGDNKNVDIASTANSHRSASSPEQTDQEEEPNELTVGVQKENVSESKINGVAPIDDSKQGSSSVGVQREIHSEEIAQECSSDSKEKQSDTINVAKQECPGDNKNVDIASTANSHRSASSPEQTDQEEESNELTAAIQKEIVFERKIDRIAPIDDSKRGSSSVGLQSETHSEEIVQECRSSDIQEKTSYSLNVAKQECPGDNKNVDIASITNSHRSASSPEQTDQEEEPNELTVGIQKENVSESKINGVAPIDDSKQGSSSVGVQREIHSEEIAQECSSDSKEKQNDMINVAKQECPGDNKNDIASIANSYRFALSPEQTDQEEKPNELTAAIQKEIVFERKIDRIAPIDDSKRGSSSVGLQSETHSEEIVQECRSSDIQEKTSYSLNVVKQKYPGDDQDADIAPITDSYRSASSPEWTGTNASFVGVQNTDQKEELNELIAMIENKILSENKIDLTALIDDSMRVSSSVGLQSEINAQKIAPKYSSDSKEKKSDTGNVAKQECPDDNKGETIESPASCYSSSPPTNGNVASQLGRFNPRKRKIKVVSDVRVDPNYKIAYESTKATNHSSEKKTSVTQSCAVNLYNSEPLITTVAQNSPKSLAFESGFDQKASANYLTPVYDEDIKIALNNDIDWSWSGLNLSVYNDPEVQNSKPDTILSETSNSEILNHSILKCQEPLNTETANDLSSNSPQHEMLDLMTYNIDERLSTLQTSDMNVCNDVTNFDDETDRSKDCDYEPSLNYSDDSIDTAPEGAKQNTSGVSVRNASSKSNNASMDFDASLLVNKVGHSAPDDTEMIVKTVEDGKKTDWCMYCCTEQAKLSRHVARKHFQEIDVAEFLSYPVGSKERKEAMDKIRKRGQFQFNTDKRFNNGERRVKRRPNAKYCRTAADFATCPSCFADYGKQTLKNHYRRCAKTKLAKPRSLLQASKKLVGRIHHKACDVLRKRVFPTLRDDKIVQAIRYDELIILFANKECQKFRDPHFYDMIRQKLRQLGRFLLTIRTLNPNIRNFFDVFFPRNFPTAIAAIQSIGGIDPSETGFKVPSIATSLGGLIKQVARLCITHWIISENERNQVSAEKFLTVFTNDFTTSVARTAAETQARNRRQKKVILPSNSDIQKLQTYLRDRLRKYYQKLKDNFTLHDWLQLAEVTLTSIQLFNRRRAGEIERILIEDYANYQKIDESVIGESYKKFTLEEKQAAQIYVRFTIRGKLNRTVAVLLHREILVCIQLLLHHRSKAGVNEKNGYLFGIPGILKGDYRYLRACEAMRKFANACGATNPSTLRGTILRKHVATMCVNFNLSEGEVSELANFLGHEDKIHKEHYRQPIIAREILRISKLLEAVQGADDDSDGDSDDDDIEQDGSQPSCSNVQGSQPSCSNVLANSTLNGQQHENGTNVAPGNNFLDDDGFDEPEAKKQRRQQSTSPHGKCSRVPWTAKEKEVASKAFHPYMTAGPLPSFAFIQQVIAANPGVFKRNMAAIKTWVNNQRKKK